MNGIKQFFSSWKGWAITGGSAAVIAAAAVFLLHKTPSYLKVIPADAKVVMMVDPAGIVDKCNLSEHSIIVDKLKDFAAHVPDESGDMLRKLIDDPNSFGIDVSQPAYFYVSGDVLSGLKAGFVMAVSSKSDLKENFDKIVNMMPRSKYDDNSEAFLKLEEEDGCCLVMIEGKPIFAFDGETLTAMFQLKYGRWGLDPEPATKAQFKQSFDLKSDEQFTSTVGWKKMQETKGEGQFFMSFGLVPQALFDMAMKQMPSAVQKKFEGLKLKDINVVSTLTFEEGQASVTNEVFGSTDEAQEKLESLTDRFEKLNGNLVNVANDKTLGWGCANLAGIPLATFVKMAAGKEGLIAAEQGMNFDFSGLLNALTGDFAIAFNGDLQELVSGDVDEEDFILDNFIVAAEASKTDFMNKFDEAQFGNEVAVTRQEGNVYKMSFKEQKYDWNSYDYNYYDDEYYPEEPEDGVYDDAMYEYDEYEYADSAMVSDDTYMQEDNSHVSFRDFFVGTQDSKTLFFAGKGVYGPNMFKGNNSRLAQHKDEITDSYGYFWVDLKKILSIIPERELQRMPSQLKTLIDKFDEVACRAITPLKSKSSLIITDKDKNFLDVMTGLIADFIQENM